jgi:hypothetical protein
VNPNIVAAPRKQNHFSDPANSYELRVPKRHKISGIPNKGIKMSDVLISINNPQIRLKY